MINHAQMPLFNTHRCIHLTYTAETSSFLQHSYYMLISFLINSKLQNCRGKMHKITYLIKSFLHNQLRRCNVPPNHRPACSSVSQQRCHPQAGHDSSGVRVNCSLIHSQGAQTTNQHSWVSQAFNKQANPTQSEDYPLHSGNQSAVTA